MTLYLIEHLIFILIYFIFSSKYCSSTFHLHPLDFGPFKKAFNITRGLPRENSQLIVQHLLRLCFSMVLVYWYDIFYETVFFSNPILEIVIDLGSSKCKMMKNKVYFFHLKPFSMCSARLSPCNEKKVLPWDKEWTRLPWILKTDFYNFHVMGYSQVRLATFNFLCQMLMADNCLRVQSISPKCFTCIAG